MNDDSGRLRFYVALATEAIIVGKGDAVYIPVQTGAAREDCSCGPVDVIQGQLTRSNMAGLRALRRTESVEHISSRKVPDSLKRTLKQEIDRIEDGRGARITGLARFCLPWEYSISTRETDAPRRRQERPPKPPDSPSDIFKQRLRQLAQRAKVGNSTSK